MPHTFKVSSEVSDKKGVSLVEIKVHVQHPSHAPMVAEVLKQLQGEMLVKMLQAKLIAFTFPPKEET